MSDYEKTDIDPSGTDAAPPETFTRWYKKSIGLITVWRPEEAERKCYQNFHQGCRLVFNLLAKSVYIL